jgi:hypothetical protein
MWAVTLRSCFLEMEEKMTRLMLATLVMDFAIGSAAA